MTGIVMASIMSLLALVLIVVMFAFDESADIMNKIVAAIAVVSGLSSVILGISSIFSTTLDNVREYFVTGDTLEHSANRKILYSYRSFKKKTGLDISNFGDENFKKIAKDNGFNYSEEELRKAVSFISNFFHVWGLLAKKRYLPMWVFESSSGFSVVKLYEGAKDIILENRLTSNAFYAENFEWLHDRILQKFKHEISICRQQEEKLISEGKI